MMTTFRRLVNAIERLASALENYNKSNDHEIDSVDSLNRLTAERLEMDRQAIAQRAAWEQIQKEHMKVCEQRYHQRLAEESADRVQ